jgi:FixJ family two-component response regulator
MTGSSHTYVAVVDDDENLCRSLSRLLRAAGLYPVTYRSAEAFLADTKGPYFDCLVLDVRLGGMSGIELGQLLSDRGSNVPVIFNTAYADRADQERAARFGCSVYLRKTESGELVLKAINRVIQPDHSKN